jgi:uncharacterized circularly permuted ATP-grasp superfamily protein
MYAVASETLPSPSAVPDRFDEMLLADERIRPPYRSVYQWLTGMSAIDFSKRNAEAERLARRIGVTFNVYGDPSGQERLIPVDLIPRVLSGAEWKRIERGCIQRVRALNAFLDDVYHGQEIIKAGKIPARNVLENACYRPEAHGVDLPFGVHAHITGVDLVRVGEDRFVVLEDNLRTPSGVSYMLQNRAMMMRMFPELFTGAHVAPVAAYPRILLDALRSTAPAEREREPRVVVLTPGTANSAYFEHAFLAQQMGIELVEGRDLFVDGDVFMRTTSGPERVDVIYRRLDDEFLDPLVFNKESLLGVPGLYGAWRSGRVSLANAIGNGVADDKATYVFVPEMIRFYLGEEPVLDNVHTWRLELADDLAYVLEHLHELVVKEVHGSGGYGMLVGPTSTKAQIEAYRERVKADPSAFIAQPTLALSTCPTITEHGVAPRHVDLRPYVVSGREVTLVPGGLTRVALKEGSLVVNSSQGGGTKDTWVLEDGS